MPQPRIAVFQHVPYEPLGTLDPLLKAAGFRLRYVNFGRDPAARPKLDGYDGLIVLGGPMNVDDVGNHPNLAVEADLIREATVAGMPVLGICLGAQLIARSEGGRVVPDTGYEIGWFAVRRHETAGGDRLLGAFGAEEYLFQWHCDSIELPDHAVALAGSDRCPVQAFRVGESTWGLQFHLEVDEPLIRRWLNVAQNRASLAANGGGAAAERIRAETHGRIAPLHALAGRTFGRWIELFEIAPRRRALPSR